MNSNSKHFKIKILNLIFIALTSIGLSGCFSIMNKSLSGINGGEASAESKVKSAALDVVTSPVQVVVIPPLMINHALSKESDTGKNPKE